MSTPKLRFKEFDGDWKKAKIGEIFEVTSGSTPLRSDNRFFDNAVIPWVKTTDLNNSLITKTEEKISEIALKETSVKILPKNTVFVAMYGGFNQIGRTGLLVNESACNQALSAIYPNEKVDSFFLLTYLNQKVDDWKNFAASSRKDPNITKNDVLAFPLIYPSKEEQTKIASFLSAVDQKINQLTQKHELLSQYKQGMMQKLFSQQIRFKADDGSEFREWENKALSNFIIKHIGGASLSPSDFVKQSEYEVIPKKAIVPNGCLNLDKSNPTYCSEEFFKANLKNTVDNTYLVTVLRDLVPSGPSIGYIVQYMENTQYILAQGVYGFKIKAELNRNFLIHFSNTKAYRLVMQSIMVGSTQVHIRNQDFLGIGIPVPCLEEQTKIANFLSAIDQKIEVVAQQIEQAKTWKKGLLQQMFV